MRAHRIARAALLVALLFPPVARAGDATGAFSPYEDILEVVADLTWHLHDDIYRFPAPKDPTGHDLYRLSLERLQNWETRYPGRLHDVTSFARGEALERLGAYNAAGKAYREAAEGSSPLADRAREDAQRSDVFADAAALPEEGTDLDGTLAALRRKLDVWGTVITRYKDTPSESVALVEEERLERRAAELVVANRAALEDGTTGAERALRFLVQKHSDSKNLPAHVLRLGDFYADLARDYVNQHDRPLGFDEDEFIHRADRALETYRKVATWDGAREKPEALGRFAALDAYKTAVLARYR